MQANPFIIPPHIALRLASGQYRQWDGIVRDAVTGQIVAHLKLRDSFAVDPVLAKALAVVRTAPRASWVTGTAAAAAAAVVAGWVARQVFISNRCRQRFAEAVALYVEALQEDAVTAAVIDELSEALDQLKSNEQPWGRSVLDSPDIEVFTRAVADYTNSLGRTEAELPAAVEEAEVVDLQGFLAWQRRMLGETA